MLIAISPEPIGRRIKMAAIYAIIDRVGSLDAGFQQVQFVQNF